MKPNLRWACIAAALAAVLPAFAHAQGPSLRLEVRGVAGYPTGDWNEDDDLGLGFGYGLAAQLEVVPGVSVYGGWERLRFDGDDDSTIEGVRIGSSDSGVRGGIELGFGVPTTGWGLFAHGGGFFGSAETELRGDGVTFVADSDSELGYEAGAGAMGRIGGIIFRPTVSYRSHHAEFAAFSGFPGSAATVSYLIFAIGLSPG